MAWHIYITNSQYVLRIPWPRITFHTMAPDKYAYIRDQGRYRIQSVDFGTFLEKRDAGVVLRNLKTDKSQQVSILLA